MDIIKIDTRTSGHDVARIKVNLERRMIMACGRSFWIFEGPVVIINLVLPQTLVDEIEEWQKQDPLMRTKSPQFEDLIALSYKKAAARDGWFEKFVG